MTARPALLACRIAAAVALPGAAAVGAGPLVITPTTVTIEPGRHSAVVEVENPGDEPVDLQFRAYDWRQNGGRDELTPTDTLVVSPAIATVAPRGRQLFRVLQTGPRVGANEAERSYRLRLNQLPRADQPAVAIYLEFLLPVFQGPAGAAPRLRWTMGERELVVTNSGNRRTRISSLALAGPGGVATPVRSAASAYLLAGASRSFALPPASAQARLVGVTDTGTIDVPPTALAAR